MCASFKDFPMATPFFGKREPETPTNLRHGATSTYPSGTSGASLTSGSGAAPASSTAYGSSAAKPVENVSSSSSAPVASEGGSKLTVGPNIKLKGVEITDCDTLVVEGTVEATMDSRVIQIAEQGAFKGSAEIDVAEIRGEFNGSLTVRQKLVIYSTGKVTGTIRYGKLVIEEGGQLSGEIMFGAGPGSSASKPATGGVKPQNLQAV
jgi:cytoskeletal protein CcmA (bactofilin family)